MYQISISTLSTDTQIANIKSIWKRMHIIIILDFYAT